MLNKKTYIRLLALVMALMMTVAVFAGCNNQEAIDEANSKADAAQQAADEAKKQAESLAQAAKDLAAQLKNTQDENDALKDAISAVDSKADQAHTDIGDYHDPSKVTTAKPVVTEPAISEKPWKDWTETADLKAFTDLKNKYLVLMRDWYTPENYAALNKIFEDASFEIYRAVDGNGLEQIVNDAATKAAQVDNVATDAAKVQALIAAFGDVPTEIFTTNEHLVIAAREAFDAWVNKYAVCFFAENNYQFKYDSKGNILTAGVVYDKNGAVEYIIERNIVDFAKKVTNNALDINVNTNTNSLLYAEAKLEALYLYAESAIRAEMAAQLIISGQGKYNMATATQIVDVLFDENETQVNINAALANYKSVLSIVDKYGVTYKECKDNGKLIEDAYYTYRIFWNANGGDDTPISGAAGEDLLTGEEFVKLYVLTLYNGELNEYQNTVKEYLYNKVVTFFLNAGNASAIDNETGWNDFLAFTDNYNVIYDKTGAEIVDPTAATYTFAVEFDRINVYDAAGNIVDYVLADGVRIEKDFNRVAATAATKIFALDYDKDFKGNKSLDDAYVVIDQMLVEAIIELTQVYYDDVIAYYLVDQLNKIDDELQADYAYTTGNPNGRHDAYYYSYDNAFYANATKVIALAKKAVTSYKVNTYDALNTIYDEEKGIENIEDQQMFTVIKDAATETVFEDIALYTGKNSAMKTVLEYFYASMDDIAGDFYTMYNDLSEANMFHELKIAVAEKLDKIAGIYELDGDKIKNRPVDSALITDFGGNVATVLGKDYKEINVYNAISAARKPGRDAIMAVEYMNYDDATVLFNFATYQAVNKDGKALYYTSAKDIKTDAKDNKALNIIVDRYVVAADQLINLYADGADAVLKAFADLVRSKIQSNVTTAIDLYKKNYDFGGLDHVEQGGVYLESDMQEFIDYLNSLTNIAAIDAYTTTKFSLLNNKVTVGNFAALAGLGYVEQVVDAKKGDYLFHVVAFNNSLEEITGVGASYEFGWYDQMAKDQLTKFFSLTSAKAYAGLEDVRELAYLKDNLINGTVDTKIDGIMYQPMPVRLASYKGVWNATTGAWTVAPRAGFEYDLSAKRTELYLKRLQEVYDAVCADIAAVTILSVKADLDVALDVAEDKIEAILTQTHVTKVLVDDKGNADPTDDVYDYKYDESDDKSLAMAYVRYYLVGQYDWVQYNANIND